MRPGGSISTLSRRVRRRRLLEAVAGWGLLVAGGCTPSPSILLKFFETGDLGPDLRLGWWRGLLWVGRGGGGVLSSWVVLISCVVEVLAEGFYDYAEQCVGGRIYEEN